MFDDCLTSFESLCHKPFKYKEENICFFELHLFEWKKPLKNPLLSIYNIYFDNEAEVFQCFF